MQLLIALTVGLAVFLLAYQIIYRSHATASRARQGLAETMQAANAGPGLEVDTQSPEYKLAQAGVRTKTPDLTWALLHWLPPLAAPAILLVVGFPISIVLAGALVGYFAPRQWISGRIKDRGLRMDEEIPKACARLLAVLRASPAIDRALLEVADTFEMESGGPTPLSTEFRQTAAEMAASTVGREKALQDLQKRAPSTSLANLGLLLERMAQTGGDRFYNVFEEASHNVQSILEARQRARAKAAGQMQAAQYIPGILALVLFYFINDPTFRQSFKMLHVQLVLAGAVLMMAVGYFVMEQMAKDAA